MNPGFLTLRPAAASPAHTQLLRADEPASPRLFAVLDGSAAGRIITDDAEHPAWCTVQEMGDGSLYLGGAVNAPILNDVITALRADGTVAVGLWPDDPRRDLLPPNPDYAGATLDFLERRTDDEQQAALARLQVPEGFQLLALDRALFKRCDWRDHEIAIYGGIDQFFTYGLGYCMVQGDEVVSESYAGPAARGMMEIGINTRPTHRRRGFALLVCARAIAACEALGNRPWWNCSTRNLASAALARKLGFFAAREYLVAAWSRLAGDRSS